MDLAHFLIDKSALVKEVAVPRTESAELAAEHRFANVAVRGVSATLPIEQLLGPVVDAWDGERGSVQRHHGHGQLFKTERAEAMLLPTLVHVVVVVYRGDHFVA